MFFFIVLAPGGTTACTFIFITANGVTIVHVMANAQPINNTNYAEFEIYLIIK